MSQVAKIIWQYKLALETTNLPSRPSVQEIEVFEIPLKTDNLDTNILRCIDKTIIHPIIFREVLLKYIATTEIDDEDPWKKNIIKIAESFLGPLPEENSGDKLALTPEINNWIEDVADSYSKKFSFVDKYVKEMDE